MQFIFQLRFHTEFGQSLFLTGDHELLGGGEPVQAIPLKYISPEFWQATLELPQSELPDVAIVYSYILRQADGELIYDWGKDRVIHPARTAQEEVFIIDSWNHAGFFENVFYAEPFKRILLRANHTAFHAPRQNPGRPTHVFKVKAPLLRKGETICLIGEMGPMNHWNVKAPVLLSREAEEDFFSVPLDLSEVSFPISYKYGMYDVGQRRFVRYEDRDNRILEDTRGANRLTIVNDGFVVLPANTWRGAGIAIPVFSLRSEKGFGVGEFSDLKSLADWCRRTGIKLIQILPVNDTTATHTWVDSYPYSAISAFALHPLYLNLKDATVEENRPALAALENERRRLNGLATVDYEAVSRIKWRYIRQIFPSQKEATFKSPEYANFFAENREWLVPYALFCYLRDKYGTANFSQWPTHREYDAEASAKLLEEDPVAREEISLHWFIQFHLHLQLKAATAYAHEQGIILKGDIAIGVYRHGADAWQMPDLFQMDVQAGAPPDAFAVKGQNWGFPTYNWPKMRATGFQWWKSRFGEMSRYFDAFRIDHILGFFRIWSIPIHAVEGILGYFVPALPVRASEFETRRIWFDRDRYVQPYITEAVLWELFGHDKEFVRQYFLVQNASGTCAFKPEFSTQRLIENCFAAWEKNDHNQKLKLGLFDLLSNVILLVEGADSQGEKLHFRFGIEKTSSFQNLDLSTQSQLKDLYVDYFYRRQEEFWRREAMGKLPTLKSVTNMLVCGEDLGMVPACVPEVMKQLGLLSLEIQRMPKDMNREFFRPNEAPYLSVVTPSTHDMSTIRGWWEEDAALTQRFFNSEFGLPGPAPKTCEAWINKVVVLQHLASPAMWSIFQLQDLLGMNESLRRPNPHDERINVPANPRNYWRYRMHLSLEDLLRTEAFSDELKAYLLERGR